MNPSAKHSDADNDDSDSFATKAFQDEQTALKDRLKQSALLYPPSYVKYALPVILAVYMTNPSLTTKWIFVPLGLFIRQIVGISVGVAFGLGLAAHVYDVLTEAHEQQRKDTEENEREPGGLRLSGRIVSSGKLTKRNSSILQVGKSPSHIAAASFEDEQTFRSLLVNAGYERDAANRGQVLRMDTPWLNKANYGFDGNDRSPLHSLTQMREYWPSLPDPVLQRLSTLTEYILRDFVGCWFKSVAEGIEYRDAKEVLEEKLKKEALGEVDEKPTMNGDNSEQRGRVMIYTMAQYRRSPFLTALYSSTAVLFGNLATRVEHVNVPALLLLKWTRVLAHTFKVYRSLRKSVLSKNQASARPEEREQNTTGQALDDIVEVSEIEMTKEFLFAGKLHKAVIFGLDIPSLLFADASGRECGVPGRRQVVTDDEVLARRLFETKMIAECELDYNRVLSHRMVRALITRQDFGSPIVSSLLVEILAGCALTPLMSCFCPDYLNSWIMKGLASSDPQSEGQESSPGVPAGDHAIDSTVNPKSGEFGLLPAERVDNMDGRSDAILTRQPDIQPYVDGVGGPSPRHGEHTTSTEDSINSLLALALIDLQRCFDFDDYRAARKNKQEVSVDWDSSDCRAAVLRLVLVVELALTDGRCTYRTKEGSLEVNVGEDGGNAELDELDLGESQVEVTLPEYESATLSQILMEMTSDVDSFEKRIEMDNELEAEKQTTRKEEMVVQDSKPSVGEQSTLRTLIAAWLHTGQMFRNISVLLRAEATVLSPYYRETAFMRSKASVDGFVKQLKALNDIDILVDTMTVLASPRLDETRHEDLQQLVKNSAAVIPKTQHNQQLSTATTKSMSSAQLLSSNSSTPRYLDFHRNESFASSLRSERDRRMLSWQAFIRGEDDAVNPVCRSRGITQEEVALHRELHHIAKIFYTGTNVIGIRDAAKRKEAPEDSSAIASETDDKGLLSLLTVETVSPRRRIEVPDDDSSFLLRAQPRPLNAVGVHRDQRNHDQSFKCFAATCEEPAKGTRPSLVANGRFLRRCLVRYYPIDRTATVAILNDSRKLDQRKSKVPDTITLDQESRSTPFLSSDFLRDRHLCHRYVPKGTARSQSILASSVIEPADFTSMPRPGKAMDFVYRLSFFERPMVDLRGHHFTIHDSAALGVHRSDASAMEISDASLSAALYILGGSEALVEDGATAASQPVQMGQDGYPVVWMKFSRKQEDAQVEVKPYRASFVRAALMITAARQEAQLQCLISCVRAGSAKNATKALTDARLKSTLKLIEYAGHRSREKQSVLLRDLKLGVNHIDRQQLRRNGLLDPRYPTELLDFSVIVEDAVQSDDHVPNVPGADFFGVSVAEYKIRCTAKVLFAQVEIDDNDNITRPAGRGHVCQEEWVIHRTFKEFQTLHRHLKGQVAAHLSSGTPASRLVGAATAAFAPMATPQGRHRQAFIPSLSQASKAGALGVTKKSIAKRKEILNDYLSYLLSPRNPVRTCAELTLFLGAFYPLPRNISPGEIVSQDGDILGRSDMSRIILEEYNGRQTPVPGRNNSSSQVTTSDEISNDPLVRSTSISGLDVSEIDEDFGHDTEARKFQKIETMLPSIKSKIEKVPLGQVRKCAFELLRYQFGFENASFIRNRMLAALRTASLAVTSPGEFQKTLYKLHTKHLSGKAVGDLIQLGLDLLWPNGVFFESGPPYTEDEIRALVEGSKKALHSSFPEAVRTVLGSELTEDGLNIFHEMLQNRLVVKSMAYMLFDLLWLEVFPEIGDILQCGAVLDMDS